MLLKFEPAAKGTAKVVPNASFTEDLGADSLDAVELIMAIEEAFAGLAQLETELMLRVGV